MSQIQAVVQSIRSKDSLHIVKCDFEGMTLSIITLELPSFVTLGAKVLLGVKPTQIVLGTQKVDTISYQNQIEVTIDSIEFGELLSAIALKTSNGSLIDSIITTESAKRLAFKKADKIIAFIKATEVSIIKDCDA